MTHAHVLLVEDDDMSRFMMSECLETLGFSFEVARDGQECIDILMARPDAFQTVLMDIHMPRKTGLEALSEIRNQGSDPPKNIRVVAVSADVDWHDTKKAQCAGFNDVLPKPVRLSRITEVLA